MKVKVPLLITVGGHQYKIVFNPKLGDGYGGGCDHKLQIIDISPNLPQSQMDCSLIHELLHLIDRMYKPIDLNEATIEVLSQGLLQVMRGLGLEFDWSNIGEVDVNLD